MLVRALALTLVAVLVPAAAGADDAPTPEELAEARIHFERARSFEDDGKYERAADEYLSAYALYPDPEFFFNVGRVYRLAGDRERALRYYERYLELDPNGRGAAAARAQARELRDELAAASDADDDTGDDDTGDDHADEARDRGADSSPGPLDPSQPDAAVQASGRPGEGASTMRTAGIATGAAGVVALGASAFFGNRARSLSNEISAFVASDPPEWTDEMIAKYRQGRRANTTMLVLGGVGIAAVTTGAVLYVMADDDGGPDEPRRLAIGPVFTPGGAAITLGGSF